MLCSHLQDVGSWQETLRALYFVEALLEGDTAPAGVASKKVYSFFHNSPETIYRASRSTQSTVRQRAERVLRLLGKSSTSSVSQHTEEASLTDPTGPPQDLLSLSTANEAADLNPSTTSDAIDLLAQLGDSQQGIDAGKVETHASLGVVETKGGDGLGEMLFGDWTASQPSGEGTKTEKPPLEESFNQMDLLDGFSSAQTAPAADAAPFRTIASPHDSLSVLLGNVEPTPFKSSISSRSQNTLSAERASQSASRLGSLSNSTPPHDNGVQGAMNAAASGINSSKREDLAFGFIQGTMAELKSKR